MAFFYASVPNTLICVNAGNGEGSSAFINLYSFRESISFSGKLKYWASPVFFKDKFKFVPSENSIVPSVHQASWGKSARR